MLSNRELSIYNESLVRIYRQFDVERLRKVVMEHIYELVPFDSGAFFAVDSNSTNFLSPYFSNLDPKSFEKYEKYYEQKDDYKNIVFSGEKIPPVDRASDYMHYKEWSSNEHRSDFLVPQGIWHMGCIQVMDGQNLIGEISLHRAKGSPDFSDKEMAVLEMFQAHISSAYKTAVIPEDNCYPYKYADIEHFGVGIMDLNQKIMYANNLAEKILRCKTSAGDNFYNYLKTVCKYLFKNSITRQSDDTYVYTESVSTLIGPIKCRIVLVEEWEQGSFPYFLIIMTNTQANNHSIRDRAKEYDFTNREMDILSLIVQGKTNRQMARILGISENTVKSHIKRIYLKTGFNSRAELVFKVLSG